MAHNSSQPRQQQTPAALAGRAAELRQLNAALDQAGRGSGRTLLLAGAMGMGKSRMVQEAMTVARGRGHLVLDGSLYPLDDRLPNAIVLNGLRPYLRGTPAAVRAALLGGLPILAKLIGGPEQPGESGSGVEQAFDQVRLLDEVARITERIAGRQPVLWCIDDLHLADPASVELFGYLARQIRNQRVLLLAAYRNDDAAGLRHLRAPLLAMERRGLAQELGLPRLCAGDVALLVAQRLGARPAHALLDYLEDGAMGNPAAIASLLDSLKADGFLSQVGGAVGLNPAAAHHAPAAAREMVLERLLSVGPREREILNFLAVMGGSAEQGELARAMQRRPAELLAGLALLEEYGLIQAAEQADGVQTELKLSYPFLRAVLYTELPALVRRDLHARVATALETLTPAPLERLAHQYEGSGGAPNPERGLEVILRVAQEAVLAGGPGGIRYYRAALGLVRSGILPGRLPAVLLGLGRALLLSGEVGQAREALAEALAGYEKQGDQAGAAAMHRHAAYIELTLSDLAATEAHAQQGIALLGPDSRSPDLADLYGMILSVHMLRGETGALAQDAADLDRIAGLLNDPAARVWQLYARLWVELLSGQVAAAAETAVAALEEAWRAEDPGLVPMATLGRAFVLLLMGDHVPAATVLRSTLERIPRGYLAVADHMLGAALAMAESLGGNWEAALRVSDESLPLEPFMHVLPRSNLGARAAILIRKGDFAAARGCLDEAARYPRPFVTDCDYAEALFALESGEYERAIELGARLYTWSLAPLGLALVAEAQAALGDVDAARNQAFLLTSMGQLGLPLAAALGVWANGLADRTAGDRAAAMAHFDEAAGQFEALAMPFETARARFEHAQLLAETDRRSAALLARRSLQLFAQFDADGWVERVHHWQAGQTPVRTPKAKPNTAFSSRELEVLRLLDEGLTNAEIAARLVLSPRTVENHLDRMYTRHGLRNRLSLLRFAREGGYL